MKSELPAVFECPHCKSAAIMNIDVAVPPMLFECATCNRRFHRLGFSPSEVEVNTSLAASQAMLLSTIVRK